MLNASVTACSSSIGCAAANGDRARNGREGGEGKCGLVHQGFRGRENRGCRRMRKNRRRRWCRANSVRGAARTDAVDADADGPLDGLVGG